MESLLPPPTDQRRRQLSPHSDCRHTRRDSLDTYDVGEEIGKGAFGSVYMVTNNESKTKYAMKKVHKDSKHFRMLENEIYILKVVRHKYIVHLHEVIETKNDVYMFLELCTYGDLKNLLDQQPDKHFCENDAKHFMIQLVDALEYLHFNKIVHRDVKLDNILVTTSNKSHSLPLSDIPFNELEVRVIDFGFSIRKNTVNANIYETCGTPIYMAPEILEDTANKAYSQLCDVWSLAVIGYMLLCGHPPYLPTENSSLHTVIIKGKLNWKQKPWEDVSDSAKEFLKKMLVVNTAHRATLSEQKAHQWLTGTVQNGISNVIAMMKDFNNDEKSFNEEPDPLENLLSQTKTSGDAKPSTIQQEAKSDVRSSRKSRNEQISEKYRETKQTNSQNKRI